MKEAGRAIEKYQPLWGSWKVAELIGQGNGSEVYKVYKEEWGKRYISTVKLLSFSIGKNDIKEAQAIGIDTASMGEYFKSLVGNILNEIELMYRLRGNSNIATYEDHAIYDKRGNLGWDVLIRMEFLQPLPDFLIGRELGRLDVVKLGIDICKALEACCREGIIHRDIKDSSIFVSPKGEFKLGSFSMAKELSKGGRMVLSQFNPLYMAPELYMEQSYDFSVDIYSLGIAMYKLLNKGRLPFLPLPPNIIAVYDTERSIARRMAGENPELPADAGENLGAIILKACSYDKKDRYKSPNEFRQKLERFLKAEAKPVKSDSLAAISTSDCTVVEVNYEEAQIIAEKEEAAAQAAYAEELERIAVVELVASVDKMHNTNKLKKKKLIRNIGIWTAIVILAFAFAFISAYEVEPAAEKPAVEEVEEATQDSNSSKAALTLTPEPTMAKSEEMNNQPKAEQKQTEVKRLYNKAVEYYKQQDYEKAIDAFAVLTKADAAYSSSAQYEDSYFQLAGKHNLLGMQYFNEGKLEQSVKEFDAAIELLEKMKKSLIKYDMERYSKWSSIYAGNKSSIIEKLQKIEEHFKLADDCNKKGVNHFNQGSYYRAKLEFENALEQLNEIRLLVPGYSSNGYDGLLQIYEGNLSRTELKL